MAPEPPSADPLLASARAGDGRALRTIYDDLGGVVAFYLRTHGVEDVSAGTNEVFHRVFSRLGSFTGDERSFRSWVFTIAHNLVVDEHRRRSRRVATFPVDRVPDQVVEPSAEHRAMEWVGLSESLELIDRLTTDQRAVILLRIIADLSLEETARSLGKPVGAVKALQHRAIRSLRRMTDEAVSPVGDMAFTPTA